MSENLVGAGISIRSVVTKGIHRIEKFVEVFAFIDEAQDLRQSINETLTTSHDDELAGSGSPRSGSHDRDAIASSQDTLVAEEPVHYHLLIALLQRLPKVKVAYDLRAALSDYVELLHQLTGSLPDNLIDRRQDCRFISQHVTDDDLEGFLHTTEWRKLKMTVLNMNDYLQDLLGKVEWGSKPLSGHELDNSHGPDPDPNDSTGANYIRGQTRENNSIDQLMAGASVQTQLNAEREKELINYLRHLLDIDLQTLINSKSLEEALARGLRLTEIKYDLSDNNLQDYVTNIREEKNILSGLIRAIQRRLGENRDILLNFDKTLKVVYWETALYTRPRTIDHWQLVNPRFRNPPCGLNSSPNRSPIMKSMTEIVHNIYPRTKVPCDNIKPRGQYRGICRLVSEFEDQGLPAQGTGWMITDDVLVTAGHVVYDRDTRAYATAITAYIGHTADSSDLNGNNDIHEEIRSAKCIALHWGYLKTGQTNYDFALVRLVKGFANVEHIRFGVASEFEHEMLCKIVGYPADVSSDNNISGHVMYEVEGPGSLHADYADYTLGYWLDTGGGMSGAPVFKVLMDGSDSSYVIGVHCSGGHPNRGSAIGHAGNVIDAFLEALSNGENRVGRHAERLRQIHPSFAVDAIDLWTLEVELARFGQGGVPN